ncbi:MAG: hypothetical protein PHT99_00320 [Methanoregula sp.]|nr:hypothetical protein [Methanoregula sp.]
MKICTLMITLIVLLTCILAAGCIAPSTQPPVQVPVTTQTTAPPQEQTPIPTQTCSLVPEPTQQVPDYESVSVSVDRNTISENPTITTTFNGGQGLGMVQSMTMLLIRSDCVVEQQTRRNPGIGASITQMGTTKTDRVIVTVLMTSGDQYTIVDQDYPFPGKI